MTGHRYQVSQSVFLAESAGHHLKPLAAYRITAVCPPGGAGLQYRVKGDHEAFERIVSEFQITGVEPPALATQGEVGTKRGRR